MPLIKSVSGFRGTIGGISGDNLTPVDIVECTSAFGLWLEQQDSPVKVVVGRDGRISGNHVQRLVVETLRALGIDVIDVGLSTTPTVAMYVVKVHAQGGIVITASHNPRDWNALKFLDAHGEFISPEAGHEVLDLVSRRSFVFAPVDEMGRITNAPDAISHHIKHICALPLVDVEGIQEHGFHVVVDCINSTGALAIPPLLEALGCTATLINGEVTGAFAHNPEPLDQHLGELKKRVVSENADLGIAVDPDVDRLAFVSDDGTYFGEEYTLVAVADYVLGKTPGNTVSNLSSTQALKDVTEAHGMQYSASAVGEVHVVREMKRTRAVIGGEGNGGVIYPDLHFGRDALVGIALMLSHLVDTGKPMSELRDQYPGYIMVKDKLALEGGVDGDAALEKAKAHFAGAEIDTTDGVKIMRDKAWVQLRKSNTEPVVRIYAESRTREEAEKLIDSVKSILR